MPRLPRLSDKGPAVGKGPPRDVLIGHFWRAWPRISRAFYLEQWLDLGFQKGLSDSGAQNLDRFQPLLEGGRPLLAGGLALTVRRGEADLGFQKGLSDWGAQNLDRFQPLLEGGRALLAGGSGSRLSGSAKQIWGFRRASATGGPRTLTGSSHSWKGVGHSWKGGLAPDCPARRSTAP